jgi:hypothetical protein
MTGGELTFLIDATNKTERARQLAVYDQSTGYTMSTLIDETGKTHQVKQVHLWEGERKTSAYEASRGIPVESKQSVTLEMIFKEIPPATQVVKLFNLHPYTATRLAFIRFPNWSHTDLPFKDIRVRK